MITVEQLYANLHGARLSGVLTGNDTLVKIPTTGDLAVLRDGVFLGYIDLNTGQVEVFVVPKEPKIKGLSAQHIIVDEISAFLEAKEPGRTDEDGKDVLYRHMAANEEPRIQRGEGI